MQLTDELLYLSTNLSSAKEEPAVHAPHKPAVTKTHHSVTTTDILAL